MKKKVSRDPGALDESYKITMTLADGTPIASRFGTKEYYLFKGRVDHDFAAYSLKIYANEKGVVVKSYNVTEQGVSVIVDWK